jgi:hypothetical protein
VSHHSVCLRKFYLSTAENGDSFKDVKAIQSAEKMGALIHPKSTMVSMLQEILIVDLSTVFALSGLVKLALEAHDLRSWRAHHCEENFVGLGIHTLDLALVVVIVSHLKAIEVVECLILASAFVCVVCVCAADQDHQFPRQVAWDAEHDTS